jgi:hypothetical protein
MNSHRDLCNLAAIWLLDQSNIQLVAVETKFYSGIADVLGITTKETSTNKDIVVIEVKRTRADLLQDLNKGKMLKYIKRSTKCYLAATSEALNLDKLTIQESIKDLESRGLPKDWGVLLLPSSGKDITRVLRNGRRRDQAKPASLRYLITKIALSYMYKYIANT